MKNQVEIIKLDTQDETPQDNSAYILIAKKTKTNQIAFDVDQAGK